MLFGSCFGLIDYGFDHRGLKTFWFGFDCYNRGMKVVDDEDGGDGGGCGGDDDVVGMTVEKVSDPKLWLPWEDHKLSPVT